QQSERFRYLSPFEPFYGATHPYHQEGRNGDVTDQVSHPPGDPQGGKFVPLLQSSEAEAEHSERGTNSGAHEAREQEQPEHITDPLECFFPSGITAYEPRAGIGFQSVAGGYSQGRKDRALLYNVDEKSPDQNPGPELPSSEHQ